MTTSIQFKFMVEKSIGKGEDADPILFSTESSAITGVYDGMGGSGASLCTSEFEGQHTKAYVASRIIRDAIDDYIIDGDITYIITDFGTSFFKNRQTLYLKKVTK